MDQCLIDRLANTFGRESVWSQISPVSKLSCWDIPTWQSWSESMKAKTIENLGGFLGPPQPSAASNYSQVPRKAAAPKSGLRGRNSPWRFASRNAASVPHHLPPYPVHLFTSLPCRPLYLPIFILEGLCTILDMKGKKDTNEVDTFQSYKFWLRVLTTPRPLLKGIFANI